MAVSFLGLAVFGFAVFSLGAPEALAQKALVTNDDRERVLNMLSPRLPGAESQLEGEEAGTAVTIDGVILENLPESLNTEAIKKALASPVSIPIYAHNPTMGPIDAPVTIVEFSDISCKTCPDMHKTLNKITQKHSDHVLWVHKHASVNPFGASNLAAFYSKIANRHDLFWPFREEVAALSEHTEDSLVGALSRAGLPVRNSQKVVRLYAREVYRELDADLALNIRLGLKSPPAVLVDGIVIGGAIPLEKLDDVVEYRLRQAGVAPQASDKKNNKAERQN